MPERSPSAHSPMHGRAQPPRASVLNATRLRVLDDTLTQVVLGRIRDGRTDTAAFSDATHLLASRLLWEAGAGLATTKADVPGFSGTPIGVDVIADRIAGVAILRAGLLFASAFRDLYPGAPLHQIGLRRDEDVLEARQYTQNLPQVDDWADHVLLLEPMLATGGSALAALRVLREHHAGPVTLLSLIAAPLGVANVLAADPQVEIIVCALDDALNEMGYIVPGLGDAGDRFFGT